MGWYAARLSGCLTAGTLLIFFLLRFDGQQRATRAAATVLRNQASALAEEVVRRSHAEARLQNALTERKVFADILESTDAMVQVADLDFRWLAINKAAADEFERIFGVRPNVGDGMLDILKDKPEQRAAVEAVWSRALGGEVFTETGSLEILSWIADIAK